MVAEEVVAVIAALMVVLVAEQDMLVGDPLQLVVVAQEWQVKEIEADQQML
jgi:hypothetical protein